MRFRQFLVIAFCIIGLSTQAKIFDRISSPEAVNGKIADNPWADSIYSRLVAKIEPIADRHTTDPEWIVSRLAMYWEPGKHYTQCFMRDQNWDYGEGNAPVPTVRMPGMRTWNKYKNVPLADRIPYNATGDMLGISISDPTQPPVLIPYKQSGHMIRGNNVEILTIAEESALLYWLTNEIKYAKLAASIYNTWLIGTYYMSPILDPQESSGGKGGWEPGGICGYYDYEQIHDDLAMHAIVVYDFIYDYLQANPDERITDTGKSIDEVTSEVMKRFIDIGLMRGGKSGNWNVNGWNMILLPILSLGENSEYADGHGRNYYLNLLVKETTQWHDAIPDIVTTYDKATGLWPESPGYAFSTVSMLLDFASLLYFYGIDIIREYPILEKAAMAVFPWMDSRGNMIVFGDSRGGAANFATFERLLSYYHNNGERNKATKIATAINSGLINGNYHRERNDWKALFLFLDSIPNTDDSVISESASYSPFHRIVTLKDDCGLMAIVYGGRNGSYLTANGLAMQLYGFGYAFAPDAAGYESYWSKDYAYHQSPVGANTIMPGYTEGDITINAIWPNIPSDSFVSKSSAYGSVKMADISAGEKRRIVALVPKIAASGGGYYIDIFSSDLPDNHYIYHNIGKRISMMDANGKDIPLTPVASLDTAYHRGYQWLERPRKATGNVSKVIWDVSDSLQMVMHTVPSSSRTYYAVDAPYTTLNPHLTPDGVSSPPHFTPTLIISQRGESAAENPFINVFEPSVKGKEYIKSVDVIRCNRAEVVARIYFIDGTYDEVHCSSPGEFNVITH